MPCTQTPLHPTDLLFEEYDELHFESVLAPYLSGLLPLFSVLSLFAFGLRRRIGGQVSECFHYPEFDAHEGTSPYSAAHVEAEAFEKERNPSLCYWTLGALRIDGGRPPLIDDEGVIGESCHQQ